jgi:hypothetical protein
MRSPNASRVQTNPRILVAMESAEQVRTPSPAPLTPIQVSAVGIDTPRGPQGTGLFGSLTDSILGP